MNNELTESIKCIQQIHKNHHGSHEQLESGFKSQWEKIAEIKIKGNRINL